MCAVYVCSYTLFVVYVLGVLYNCIKMAMSDEHRKRLRKNRVALVKDMNIDEDLLSHLMTNGIITIDMKEKIQVGVLFLCFESFVCQLA